MRLAAEAHRLRQEAVRELESGNHTKAEQLAKQSLQLVATPQAQHVIQLSRILAVAPSPRGSGALSEVAAERVVIPPENREVAAWVSAPPVEGNHVRDAAVVVREEQSTGSVVPDRCEPWWNPRRWFRRKR